jgi:sucrose-phosphate synthase
MDMNQKKWLIVCDIDGTLLFEHLNHPGLKQFNDFIESNRDSIILALNSGRNLQSLRQAVEEGPIVRPDFMICSLGTEIYSDGEFETEIPIWGRRMRKSWNREAIREKLEELPYLQEQEEVNQRPSKLSYIVLDNAHLVSRIKKHLGPLSKKIKIIPSHEIYLDIMPYFAGKGEAVKYLAKLLKISGKRIITAGDSGNDLDMLACGFKSIVVSNHTVELYDFPATKRMYYSSFPASLGVLDGFAHHKVFSDSARLFFRQHEGTEE